MILHRPLSSGRFAAIILIVGLFEAFYPVRVVHAQDFEAKHEFRGAWIATVVNLDWPSDPYLSTSQQKAELTSMINTLADTGINAIFLQIRPEADALYESAIEPWSYWLTGGQGQAPNPFYDPLAFAVETAHERGVELHAWFNPFRVRTSGVYTIDPSYVSVQHPEWVLQINGAGGSAILNPGIPEVRDYIVGVIEDVVRRYDIDGVHFDDFFYPYPPNDIESEDLVTYQTYGGSFMNVADWRRDNINQFIRAVSEMIVVQKPDLKFGISPFGIWKNGIPAGTSGLDAFNEIYADPPVWVANGWVDYLAPQLYWPFGGAQDFQLLGPWWVSVSNGRHIYPGLAVFRAAPETWSRTLYAPTEIPRQIRFSRSTTGVEGNIFFRAENLTKFNSSGASDSLRNDLYAGVAITPPMLYRPDIFAPGAPYNLGFIVPTGKSSGTGPVNLTWDPPFSSPLARKFAVYRLKSATEPDPRDMTNDPANLIGVTYEPFFSDDPPLDPVPYYYVVTALNANSIESDESNMISANVTGLPVERELALPFRFVSVAPNPARDRVEIRFETDRQGPVRLQVFDMLGRRRATLLDESGQGAGAAVVFWNGEDASGRTLASGTYLLVLTNGSSRVAKTLTWLH